MTRFKHIFPDDPYLGRYQNHDLYMHVHRSGRNTLYARYGNEKWEFISWGGQMPPPNNHILQEAWKRWEKRGKNV